MIFKGRKILRIALITLLVVVSLAGATAVGIWITVRRSLPMIDGEIILSGPKETIRILRDGHGVPTIQADGRDDLAFGLGFVHGQDRFFQMDGLRRYAAGEISEIFGLGSKEECIKWDRRIPNPTFSTGSKESCRRSGKWRASTARSLRGGSPSGPWVIEGPPLRVLAPPGDAKTLVCRG